MRNFNSFQNFHI